MSWQATHMTLRMQERQVKGAGSVEPHSDTLRASSNAGSTLLQAFRPSGMGNQPHLPEITSKNNQPIAQPRQHASRLNMTVRLNKQQALIEVQSS